MLLSACFWQGSEGHFGPGQCPVTKGSVSAKQHRNGAWAKLKHPKSDRSPLSASTLVFAMLTKYSKEKKKKKARKSRRRHLHQKPSFFIFYACKSNNKSEKATTTRESSSAAASLSYNDELFEEPRPTSCAPRFLERKHENTFFPPPSRPFLDGGCDRGSSRPLMHPGLSVRKQRLHQRGLLSQTHYGRNLPVQQQLLQRPHRSLRQLQVRCKVICRWPLR